MSITINPIVPWPVLVVFALLVIGMTLWPYRSRLRSSAGAWRWVAFSLRMVAVLLCLIAALRPSVLWAEKKQQPASLLFLVDESTSMTISDQAGGRRRWDVAREAIAAARRQAKDFDPNIEPKFYRFSSNLSDWPTEGPAAAAPPVGRSTALGTNLIEARKQQSGSRVAAMIVMSDGASNDGLPALSAAERLKREQIPIIAVGIGEETAGAGSRDIAARELIAGPTVFVKNELQARGTLAVRGFPNTTLDVELYVENQPQPVATTRVKIGEGGEVIPITGLKYVPQTPGETKLTLKVKPLDGELVKSNNEVSTYVTVLKGGLAALYLKGPNFSWDPRYLTRALDNSPDIQVDFVEVRRAASGNRGEVPDEVFNPGRYDVFLLGDLPAEALTRNQQRLLAAAVRRGAGLMMMGGRSSFGSGGWSGTDVAGILPVDVNPGDGQVEPEGGIPFTPNANGLISYLLALGAGPTETQSAWASMPPLTGTNRFGRPKPAALVLATSPDRLPLMIAQDVGQGRSIAFGGETWVWARSTDESRQSHRKFWRQVIFWLAHKEDQGDTQVKLTLDRRRVALGQKLDFLASAVDPKGESIRDAVFEAQVARLDDPAAEGKPEPIEMFAQPSDSRGSYFASTRPGEYRLTVSATRQGKPIGSATARFLVFQDDRELENPAANLALLRQIAELTGGEFLPPEELPRYLSSLDGKAFTETVSQTERRLWDNWPFFLIFTAVICLEWLVRKRVGWV